MTAPQYLQSINIRCAAKHCRNIVKSDGITTIEHVVLKHKFSRSETLCLCRRCANRADVTRPLTRPLTGPGGNWTVGERVEVEKIA
jgi:hypothetical protein